MAISINLNLSNIGPHCPKLNFSKICNTNETLIFACNGRGKTAISRMFRLAEKNPADLEETNSLLTIGETTGSFQFEVRGTGNSGTTNKTLNITLNRNSLPLIKNDSGYF